MYVVRQWHAWLLVRCAVFIVAAVAMFSSTAHATPVNGPSLIVDASSEAVFFADRPDQRWHPASLTKLMTAYVTFEAIRRGEVSLKSNMVQSARSIKEPPSKIGYPVGTKLQLDKALRALIVKSANDVAVMIAEGVAGSERAFVERMNAAARRLGMSRSVFRNPNGLPDSAQVTTARDMAKLAVALIKQFPEHADYFRLQRVRIGKLNLKSHNRLLASYAGADGMKTGFICASGFNVVSSASRNGRRLVAIVMGAPSAKWRNARAAKLMDHGFDVAGWREFFGAPRLSTMAVSPAGNPKPLNYAKYVTAWSCGHRAGRTTPERRAAAAADPGAGLGGSSSSSAARASRPAAGGRTAFHTDR